MITRQKIALASRDPYFQILRLAMSAEAISQGDVAKETGSRRQSTVAPLRVLCTENLLEENRRSGRVDYRLTEEGREAVELLSSPVAAARPHQWVVTVRAGRSAAAHARSALDAHGQAEILPTVGDFDFLALVSRELVDDLMRQLGSAKVEARAAMIL